MAPSDTPAPASRPCDRRYRQPGGDRRARCARPVCVLSGCAVAQLVNALARDDDVDRLGDRQVPPSRRRGPHLNPGPRASSSDATRMPATAASACSASRRARSAAVRRESPAPPPLSNDRRPSRSSPDRRRGSAGQPIAAATTSTIAAFARMPVPLRPAPSRRPAQFCAVTRSDGIAPATTPSVFVP